jgi:phospholipid/cholesterol/gamma-HCH transport system substrate-binding protein
MMFLQTPEFKVGLLVVMVAGLIGVMSMKVAEGPGLLSGGREYHFVVDNAGGLVKQSAVKMAGIKVGIVDDIVLEGKKAKIVLALESGVEIDKNTRVILKSDGILGDRHVELIPGAEPAEKLEPGATIPTGEMNGGLDSVVSDVSKVAASLNELMTVLNKAVKEGDETTRIGRIAKNIEDLTRDLSQMTGENKEKLAEIIDRVHNIAKNIDENLDAETLAGVKRSVQNIEDVTEKLNKGEGTLGRLINDEETVDELNSAITNVNKFLGGANRMETSIDFHSEYLTGVDLTKTFIGLQIKPGLDRFYEIAVIDDPRGYKETSVKESSTGGTPNPVYEETTTYKSKLKFTALFGKTFYNLTLKGGIIESQGGFGVDYHLFDHRLRLSTEFFNFQDIYIRAFARYEVWKGIYVIGGGDNLAGSDNADAAAFFGAGLFITNDDLMALVGKVSL